MTTTTTHPAVRRSVVRAIAATGAWLLGLYLIGRAIAEPWVIDLNDPSTYHHDWGGPSLAGVLAVHCGPGALGLALVLAWFGRRLRASGRR